MSLDHAILGFLRYRPMTGYDLKKVFDGSVRHFWGATQSQIYRTLARLAEQGCVTQELVPGVEHPDRKEYHLTDKGCEALTRWLAMPLPSQPLRMAELIQVFFAAELPDADVLELFTRWAEQSRAALTAYDQVVLPDQAEVEAAGMAREHFFWSLTREYGHMAAQAELAWLESVIARIRGGDLPPTNTEFRKGC